MVLNTLTVIN